MPNISINRLKSVLKEKRITQTALVEHSGVSRAQLGRILRSGEVSNVRDKTLQQLAEGLGVEVGYLEVDGGRKRYCQWVCEQHQLVNFRGLGLPELKNEQFEDIYVVPDAFVQPNDHECDLNSPVVRMAEERAAAKWGWDSSKEKEAVDKLVIGHKRSVVFGNPGDGKTMFLRHLAITIANDETQQVPIFFRLPIASRAFAIDPNVQLWDLIVAKIPESHREFLASKASAGQCFFLLDGLDEVGDESQRQLLTEKLQELVSSLSENRFAVTTRVVGFDRTPFLESGFTIIGLRDFREEQWSEFIDKWSRILHRTIGKGSIEEISGSLENAIFANSRVRSLAGNPLILTILAFLNESRGGSLPRRRVDLYEKIVDVFLDTWERTKRSENFVETADVDLDSREFEWLLANVALEMQCSCRTLAPEWWLLEHISAFLVEGLGFELVAAKDMSSRVLRYLSERTGLIEARGLGEFGFSHRTFQEYFAAVGLINKSGAASSIPDLLKPHLFDPQWSEVIRLVAAKVPPLVAQKIIQLLLDDPDPVGRFIRRGHELALQCLSDGVRIPSREQTEKLFTDCQALGNSRWLGITLNIFHVLRRFRNTRFDSLQKEAIAKAIELAKRSLNEQEVEALQFFSDPTFLIDKIEALQDSEEAVKGDLVNSTLMLSKPAKWWKHVRSVLSKPDAFPDECKLLAHFFVQHSEHSKKAIPVLLKAFGLVQNSKVKERVVWALAKLDIAKFLPTLFEIAKNENEEECVRSRAVRCLRNHEGAIETIRPWCVEVLLDGQQPKRLVSACSHLLSGVNEEETFELLLGIAMNDEVKSSTRASCLWAINDRFDDKRVEKLFESLLVSEEDLLRRVAAQNYVDAACQDEISWDEKGLSLAQEVLMRLEVPCPHALASLRALARSRSGGAVAARQHVVLRAINCVIKQVKLAFFFGSCARDEQNTESDIDLLILGDVSLREISSELKKAEDELGRTINPVIYNHESFLTKLHAGDPFLTDVVKREQIPVFPEHFTKEELKDELRSLASNRLAPTK